MDIQNSTLVSSSIDGHLTLPVLPTSDDTINPSHKYSALFDVIVSGIEDFESKLEEYTEGWNQDDRSVLGRSLSPASTSALLSRNSVYSLDLLTAMTMGTVSSLMVMALTYLVGVRPGHTDGAYLPVYVSDHYTERTSRHPFDPYSWTHVSHGVLGHMAVMGYGAMAGKPETETEAFWKQGGGLLITLATGAAWEILENTEFIINRFRENSGTSADYRGDSYINVVGDVVSVGVGYLVSEWGTRALGAWFPLALFVFLEAMLAWLIRDNYLLIVQQLLFPSVAVLKWQQEIIPEDQRESSTGLVKLPKEDISRSSQLDLPLIPFQKSKAFRKFIGEGF